MAVICLASAVICLGMAVICLASAVICLASAVICLASAVNHPDLERKSRLLASKSGDLAFFIISFFSHFRYHFSAKADSSLIF